MVEENVLIGTIFVVNLSIKLIIMTYEIFAYNNKIPFLVAELGEEKVKVIETSSDIDIVKVAITIENSWDVQSLIAAGVKIGINVYAVRPA